MKKLSHLTLAIFTLLTATQTFSQTNTFPADGNVGIGTTNPSEKLHVNGNVKIEDGGRLHFDRTDGQAAGAIGWEDDGIFYLGGHPDYGPTAGSAVRVWGFGGDLRLGNNSNGDVLSILGANGNVGIGTTSPNSKLEVIGNGNNDNGILRILSTSSGADGSLIKLSAYSYINQDNSGSSYWSWGHRYDGDNNTWVRTYTGLPLVQAKLTTTGDFTIGTETSTTSSTPSFSSRFFVRNDGSVGIGTTNPIEKLHVNGNVKIEDGGRLHFDRTDGQAAGAIGWEDDGMFYVGGHPDYGPTAGSAVRVWGFGGDLRLGNNSNGDVLSILGANGNVGIGTTSPTGNLSLSSPTNTNLTIQSNSQSRWWITAKGVNDNTLHIGGDGGTEPSLGAICINSSSNVGIGTPTPDYKLDVLGTIRATEVKVETGWSDFVFHDDYHLRSLEEVEQFIAVNNHLPEIPSEKEVKKNGISLGEMDAKLLQKIEELTLYVIEQQKQINQLTAKLKEKQIIE